jgi:hypothetical protein
VPECHGSELSDSSSAEQWPRSAVNPPVPQVTSRDFSLQTLIAYHTALALMLTMQTITLKKTRSGKQGDTGRRILSSRPAGAT